ncbi:MAG: RNA methyltransferase [Rhodospirillaceae bacterium]|nr:RNA methyltransferase [Rhodospirillaceae bacterium]MDE0705307.1 RNA methyltransferase [Rhodospirillaceae bacterium]MXW90174.1 RNA methyltransferase [Rhodospirillaceae bacterium]MYB13053.1 RNA methyltransferase [Rhodospirillaceae bacterium]MYG53221.1 RNA methyltransferase [Rhodospirillaceae bacterium]
MRGYFGIGAEGLSKAMNAGALFRTAHAFGASFLFTVNAPCSRSELRKSDTSKSWAHVPLHDFESWRDLRLPAGCSLVGVELTDSAIDLPSFTHPPQAAYILGPERGSLSPEVTALCAHVVKIPTKFSVNVSLAGAIVMYDRLLTMGRFARRPDAPGGPAEPLPPPEFGPPLWVRKQRNREKQGD